MDDWLSDVGRPMRLAVCLRDVHREHILFDDDAVSGLIDFGAVGIDAPACDLARWLGSVAPDDDAALQLSLEAYRSIRRLEPSAESTLQLFDRTGCVLSALHWLERRVLESRPIRNADAADARWDSFVRRMEMWIQSPDSLR
jgi:Ser/Thr protein kinase RdoA (MazF antagonist)